MSSYFSTVAQESLCLLKFFYNTRILSPLSSLEARLQQLSCKVTHVSFSLITCFGDGFFDKINGVSSQAVWITLLILPGSPQESVCLPVLFITHLCDLIFYTSTAVQHFMCLLSVQRITASMGCTDRRAHTRKSLQSYFARIHKYPSKSL